jgi:hypothetical protein
VVVAQVVSGERRPPPLPARTLVTMLARRRRSKQIVTRSTSRFTEKTGIGKASLEECGHGYTVELAIMMDSRRNQQTPAGSEKFTFTGFQNMPCSCYHFVVTGPIPSIALSYSPVSTEGQVMNVSFGPNSPGSPAKVSFGLVAMSAGHASDSASSAMKLLGVTLTTSNERGPLV